MPNGRYEKTRSPTVAEIADRTAYATLINYDLDNNTVSCSQQHKQNAHLNHLRLPSGEYIKTCCDYELANRQNFHVWDSHGQHSARATAIPDNAAQSAHSQQQLGYLFST